jgi:5-methylcytosine-specific restriction endonuclease McrA
MTILRPKCPRLRLDPESYRSLRGLVLERDHWRCQRCGSLGGVEVHHIEPRGRLGDDSEDNLVTLCCCCHRRLHQLKAKLPHQHATVKTDVQG